MNAKKPEMKVKKATLKAKKPDMSKLPRGRRPSRSPKPGDKKD